MTRETNDFYRTPPACTQALLERESFAEVIWEPACGDGAISDVLWRNDHEVISTDLIDRGYGECGRDFLAETALECDQIITNPPFRLADEFVTHALCLGAQKIAILQRLAWLEGFKRYNSVWSGNKLARVHVFSKRQTLWRGDEISPGKGGTTAYAWFIFQADNAGEPVIRWIA